MLGVEEFSIDAFTNRINAFKDSHSRMLGITYTSRTQLSLQRSRIGAWSSISQLSETGIHRP